ncbi:MAG: alpha/beta hydrolase [Dehalococcoidia bacterium]|jgi:pimeloyl-ACP methyl ester carboxylesterase|nr:alpha/beta hydrolase [Dehalococcoidia bacterium]
MPDTTGECPLAIRHYGTHGAHVVVLHGGPGAAGYMAPVARGLSDVFRVAEPFQRRREEMPLSVARHVQDLQSVLDSVCGDEPPLLVGHSWGAMLALAYAAEHPERPKALALIGCGTFDPRSRTRLQATVRERAAEAIERRLEEVARRITDPDVRLCVTGRILESLYSCELLPHQDETVEYDARGRLDSWRDMLRLQRAGVYPAEFSRITAPVLMVHGDCDPHPGGMIRDTLASVLPQLQYLELLRCGHYPWLERHARDEFFAALRDWLLMYAA